MAKFLTPPSEFWTDTTFKPVLEFLKWIEKIWRKICLPSYLFFGKYKFRTRYEGQHTTCGYCAESDHIERDCPMKTNMKILVKKVKILRRIATTPREFNSEIEREPSPTYEEVLKFFENNVEETKRSDKST